MSEINPFQNNVLNSNPKAVIADIQNFSAGDDKNKSGYCPFCGRNAGYHIQLHEVSAVVHGVAFHYTERVALCLFCGHEMYVPFINDLNCKLREEAYRFAIIAHPVA